jgi:hypothetical protein
MRALFSHIFWLLRELDVTSIHDNEVEHNESNVAWDMDPRNWGRTETRHTVFHTGDAWSWFGIRFGPVSIGYESNWGDHSSFSVFVGRFRWQSLPCVLRKTHRRLAQDVRTARILIGPVALKKINTRTAAAIWRNRHTMRT